MSEYTYRCVGGWWILYEGRQAVWEDVSRSAVVAWARARGIEPAYAPVVLAKF